MSHKLSLLHISADDREEPWQEAGCEARNPRACWVRQDAMSMSPSLPHPWGFDPDLDPRAFSQWM